MRIALQIEIPGLIDQLQCLAPDIEAFVLPRSDEPGERLVNVSRANLVDQEALRESLDKGHISRASLDVVEPEPLPAGHWLYQHPRVVLSPHISWSGPGMVERMMTQFFSNVMAFSNDQPLQGVVDTAAGY